MSTTRRAGLTAFALSLALAGCGGGDKNDSASDTTVAGADSTVAGDTTTSVVAADGATTTVAGATATTKAGSTASTARGQGTPAASTTTLKPTAPASDVSTAKGYLLTQPDLGAGYEKRDAGAAPGGDQGSLLEKCGKGHPMFAKDNPNSFAGDSHGKGTEKDGIFVGSGATIGASTVQATEAMAIVKSDEFRQCVEDEVKALVKQADPTADVKATRLAVSGGDEATGIHLVATGNSAFLGGPFRFDIDTFIFRKKAVVAVALAFVNGESNRSEPARIAEIQKKKLG